MASTTQKSTETQTFDPITQKWRENTSQAVGQLLGGYGLSSIFGGSGLGRAPAPPMEYNQYRALQNRMNGAMPNFNPTPPPVDPTTIPPRGLLAAQRPQYQSFGQGAFRPQAGGQAMDPRMLQMMMQRGRV
jgi:hypothetical protein